MNLRTISFFIATAVVTAAMACTVGGCAHDNDATHDHDHDASSAAVQVGSASGDDHDRDEQANHDHAAGAEDGGGHGDEGEDGHDHGDDVRIPAETAQAAGIRVAPAGPSIIRRQHVVQGLLLPVEGRSARVVARFPGPVRAVRVATGDQVSAGQVLAVVESNISLSDYSVRAPIAGTVLARHVAVGDLAGDAPLFEIADLSSLWVDVHLFGADGDHIRPGLPAQVERLSDGQRADLTLERVLPGAATASQSTVARATLVNEDGRWRPGAAVRARVSVSEREAGIAVPLSAVQRYEGRDVVFVREGERYEARPVRLGERDAEQVEILAGLAADEMVVVEQSYLIKADLGKAGAGHAH